MLNNMYYRYYQLIQQRIFAWKTTFLGLLKTDNLEIKQSLMSQKSVVISAFVYAEMQF